MRTEVLVIGASLALLCVLVGAREETREDELSRGRTQGRGLREDRRHEEEGDVEMSDEPAEVLAEETKPKKKKTPEEIEAGK